MFTFKKNIYGLRLLAVPSFSWLYSQYKNGGGRKVEGVEGVHVIILPLGSVGQSKCIDEPHVCGPLLFEISCLYQQASPSFWQLTNGSNKDHFALVDQTESSTKEEAWFSHELVGSWMQAKWASSLYLSVLVPKDESGNLIQMGPSASAGCHKNAVRQVCSTWRASSSGGEASAVLLTLHWEPQPPVKPRLAPSCAEVGKSGRRFLGRGRVRTGLADEWH